MRVCFVNENIGGHGTLHHHLRIALEDHPDVDARIRGRPPRRPPAPRLPGPDPQAGRARPRPERAARPRRRLGGGPATGRPARAGHGASTCTRRASARRSPRCCATTPRSSAPTPRWPAERPPAAVPGADPLHRPGHEDRASDRAPGPRRGHPARRPVASGRRARCATTTASTTIASGSCRTASSWASDRTWPSPTRRSSPGRDGPSSARAGPACCGSGGSASRPTPACA